MCIRNVRAGADPTNNKRSAHETSDERQESLLYRQHRPPMEDVDYDGGRESKSRRLTPPLLAEEQPGGNAADPARWPSQQQQPSHHQPTYQQNELPEDTEQVSGGAPDNPRLKRNKPVKWSAEEDRRLREAVVRVSWERPFTRLHGNPVASLPAPEVQISHTHNLICPFRPSCPAQVI